MGKYIVEMNDDETSITELLRYRFIKSIGRLVECKDCMHCEPWTYGFYVCKEMLEGTDCDRPDAIVSLDHYCGYAKRRDE